MSEVAVIVPNWNGKDTLGACLDSLLAQSLPGRIIVVENGSVDGSLGFLREHYPGVEVLVNKKNLGFDGGVNTGIRPALKDGVRYIALFNNDAVADKDWLKELVAAMDADDSIGIAACKFVDIEGAHLDSTGDILTTWGLSFPRGRGEPVSDKYDQDVWIFGASGGSSLYRADMLKQIGIFDEDFFAYYEDVDISFRAQLAGWKVRYVPSSVARHHIGATSGKIHGFGTYQAIKNMPWVVWKNVPWRLMPVILPRFTFAYCSFVLSAVARGQAVPALKGLAVSTAKWPKKLAERHKIQRRRTVTIGYIYTMLTHDLPPNAHKLRRLRSAWWKITKRKVPDKR